MKQTEYDFVSSFFDGIMNMSEQSDNVRANRAAAIIELENASGRVSLILASALVAGLKTISIETHDKIVAALRDILEDIDEEIAND